MTLLAGSYERFLFGLSVPEDLEGPSSPDHKRQQLERAFTQAAHKGVVKCVAAAGQWAATGGADDLIHLYDLKTDKDLGFLMSPGDGAVTALALFTPAGAYNPTHLLSGSADGTLTVWSAGGGWEAMKTMRGHRKDVSCISVHPSGLVALTVSRDGFLRMWDLVKGRCQYTSRLEAEAEAVAFCPQAGADRYALLSGARVTVHSVTAEQGVLATLSHPRRVLCMAWSPGHRLVTGSEDGSLRLWDAQAGVELLCIGRAHASRVRALTLVADSSSSGEAGAQERLLVATCSTDGSVKLWDLTTAATAGVPTPATDAMCLAEAQTRARLTCLAAVDPAPVMQRRLAAAAAARQQAAAAAAAQQQAAATAAAQLQQQLQQGGKKRKASSGDKGQGAEDKAGEKAGDKKRKQEKKVQVQRQQVGSGRQQVGSGQQQQAGSAQQQEAGSAQRQQAGGKPKAGQPSKPAAAPAAGDAGVVVHDGVVEFLDSADQARKRKQKQAVVQQKRKVAAEQGKRFRSVPGEQFSGKARGGGGGRGGARRPAAGRGRPRK